MSEIYSPRNRPIQFSSNEKSSPWGRYPSSFLSYSYCTLYPILAIVADKLTRHIVSLDQNVIFEVSVKLGEVPYVPYNFPIVPYYLYSPIVPKFLNPFILVFPGLLAVPISRNVICFLKPRSVALKIQTLGSHEHPCALNGWL